MKILFADMVMLYITKIYMIFTYVSTFLKYKQNMFILINILSAQWSVT